MIQDLSISRHWKRHVCSSLPQKVQILTDHLKLTDRLIAETNWWAYNATPALLLVADSTLCHTTLLGSQ